MSQICLINWKVEKDYGLIITTARLLCKLVGTKADARGIHNVVLVAKSLNNLEFIDNAWDDSELERGSRAHWVFASEVVWLFKDTINRDCVSA